ncbi:hypothetical protein IQ06DRAFT_289899 [Phaeosphaeriaceae sp. SRC1lsM3a]|nr:hypothetical protein IQ06DRAFT_289899 [Stagonospora sp. SRC1lsM3a]
MNHNFLGQPGREDIQTLEQLRRQLMPMIGLLDKLHADMQSKLYRGEVVDWPHIRHTISVINAYLTSINSYINGSYKHREEALKDTNGNPILDEEKVPRMLYRDTASEGMAPRIGAMHVYPQAPFPLGNERLAGMAAVLLDKRLGGPEEKWVEERLRKAAEFAYVPGEWGIEARKPAAVVETKDGEEDEGDEEGKALLEGLPTKRVKGTLSEDEILDMWGIGHRIAFDRQFQRERGLGQDGGEEDDEDEEDEEDEEMEDVKIEGVTPTTGVDAPNGDQDMEIESEAAATPKPPPAAPVVLIQRAPAAVHQPVAGVPVMPLGFVHRFMASGEVQGR